MQINQTPLKRRRWTECCIKADWDSNGCVLLWTVVRLRAGAMLLTVRSDQMGRKYLPHVKRANLIAGLFIFICVPRTSHSWMHFSVCSCIWMTAGPSVSGEWQVLNRWVKCFTSNCDQQVYRDWGQTTSKQLLKCLFPEWFGLIRASLC